MYTITMTMILLVAVFLFGITLMRLGIKGLASPYIHQLSTKLSPINGLFFGLWLTLLLQSSSASIALLVTLLSTIKFSLPFAIYYLIGANIGTTFTTQLFVWNETHLMFICLIIGFILIIIPYSQTMLTGAIIFGLGVIFCALTGFEGLAQMIPGDTIETVVNSDLVTSFSLTTLGLVLTMLIQSSTVATGMFMSFSQEGMIQLIHIYYLLIGANIGTCFTVWLVSLKQPYESRITAYAHIWMNIIGGLVAFPIIIAMPIIHLAELFSGSIEQQVVWIAVIYNVFTGIIFILLLNPFIKFLKTVHRGVH